MVSLQRAPVSCAIALLAAAAGPTLNAQGTGQSDPRQARPQAPTELAWTAALEAQFLSGGIADAERIYLSLDGTRVAALGHRDGAVAWTRDLVTTGTPVAMGNSVYVRSPEAVVALDATSGVERWRSNIGPLTKIGPSIVGNLVLAVAAPSTLVAISASDGALVWRRELTSPPMYPPTGTTERVFAALADSRVVALSSSSGTVLWDRRLSGTLAAPTHVGGRLLVGSSSKELYALDANGGQLAWRWRIGADVVGTVAGNGMVFVASRDNVLRAFEPRRGTLRWKQAISGRPTTPPRLLGLVVIVVSAATTHMFEARTGAAIGTYVGTAEVEGAAIDLLTSNTNSPVLALVMKDGRVLGLRAKPASQESTTERDSSKPGTP